MALKVLVVDDDTIVRKILIDLLQKEDFETDFCTDGLDALVKIKSDEPDLVILDIMMPEVNGYDVCFQLRFNEDYKNIPILILTERQQELDSRIGQRLNIRYLQKPIEHDLVLKNIELLLNVGEDSDG